MNNSARFFEIPEDSDVMAKIIESVPTSWSFMDGVLCPTKDIIASGQVEERTGFNISRFYSINPTIAGENVGVIPNLFGILVEQKIPAFISFEEAGYEDHRIITFELVKRIAAGFVRKGYRGHLSAFRDCQDDDKYNNSAKCKIALKPFEGSAAFDELGQQPPRVRLEWRAHCDEYVAPIVTACQSLNLLGYSPNKK